MTRSLPSIFALSILLAAPLAKADPPGSCCFTGPVGTCIDISMASICSLDPYCCNNWWDGICVSHFEDYHEWTCPPLFRGNYTTGGEVEVSEFAADACGVEDPIECQWAVYFDLPANRAAGSSGSVGFGVDFLCAEGTFGGGGGDEGLLQIFSNANGTVRGMLHTDWFYDLEGSCAEPLDGILIQVTPRTNKSCFTASTSPRCNDPATETCVCHDDPFCCQTAWDGLCVAEATSFECP